MNVRIATAVASSHLAGIHTELSNLCDTLKDELQTVLLNTDLVNELIADTNTCGWSVDVFEIELLGLRLDNSGLHLKFYFQASGEQDDDKMIYGDSIEGRGTMNVHGDELVLLSLSAAIVEPPAERDGEEDAINDCEPEDGPDEDE